MPRTHTSGPTAGSRGGGLAIHCGVPGRVGHRREGGAGGGSIHGGLAAGGGLQVVAEYCCLAVGCNGGSRGTVRWCLENPTFPQLTQAGASGICLAMERS